MMGDEYILRLERVAITVVVLSALLIIGLGLYVRTLAEESKARDVVLDELSARLQALQEHCP